jgi:hypothetical protein
MHFKSLRHVRDHAKVRGTAHHLLNIIASHINMHTGEAFELTVERLANYLGVTPQWVGRLVNSLLASGELVVQRSRGRHANVYRIPYEHCHACQGDNPKVEFGVEILGDEINPKVTSSQPQTVGPATPTSGAPNPKVPSPQPQSHAAPTPKSGAPNPKVGVGSNPPLARIEPQKEVKEKREKKERPTTLVSFGGEGGASAPPGVRDEKPERQNPWWCEGCGVMHAEPCRYRGGDLHPLTT